MQVLTYFRVPKFTFDMGNPNFDLHQFWDKVGSGYGSLFRHLDYYADNRATKKQVRNYFDRVDCTSYSYSDKNYMLQIIKIFVFHESVSHVN